MGDYDADDDYKHDRQTEEEGWLKASPREYSLRRPHTVKETDLQGRQ